MSETRHDVELRGCAPVPLAHYLKALGILRLVAEQVDPQAQGWWDRDVFWLRSTLDAAASSNSSANGTAPRHLLDPGEHGLGSFRVRLKKGRVRHSTKS